MIDVSQSQVLTGEELFEGAVAYPAAEMHDDEPEKKGTAGHDGQNRRTKGEDE